MDSITPVELINASHLRKHRRLRSAYIDNRPLYLSLLKHFRDSGLSIPPPDRKAYLIEYRKAHKVRINERNLHHRTLRKARMELKVKYDVLNSASIEELRSAIHVKEELIRLDLYLNRPVQDIDRHAGSRIDELDTKMI
jgi:hypothetical protein